VKVQHLSGKVLKSSYTNAVGQTSLATYSETIYPNSGLQFEIEKGIKKGHQTTIEISMSVKLNAGLESALTRANEALKD